MKHSEKNKKRFWKEHSKVRRNRMVYRILGWFIYPFIQRTKVRNKINSNTDSWWTKRLWYMMNDDELIRNDYIKIDYDVDMVEEKGIPLWFASYWFNALRNSAYNYILSHPPSPYTPLESYSNKEYAIDNIFQGKTKVDPLLRAEWVKLGDKKEVSKTVSKVGEGEIWYNPNGDKSISICRYSKAYIKKFLFWNLYITYQKGEFNGGRKYDTIFHIDKVERR